MSPEQIPKYIKYDFFVSLIGLSIIYISISKENIFQNSLFFFPFIIIGSSFFFYGLHEMKENYIEEKKLTKIRRDIELIDLKNELKKRKKP